MRIIRLVVALSLTACAVPEGTVVIDTAAFIRTGAIEPALFDSLDILVEGDDFVPIEEPLTLSGTSVRIQVPAGDNRRFLITATRLAADNITTIKVYEGETIADIIAGEENNISITMFPLAKLEGTVTISASTATVDTIDLVVERPFEGDATNISIGLAQGVVDEVVKARAYTLPAIINIGGRDYTRFGDGIISELTPGEVRTLNATYYVAGDECLGAQLPEVQALVACRTVAMGVVGLVGDGLEVDVDGVLTPVDVLNPDFDLPDGVAPGVLPVVSIATQPTNPVQDCVFLGLNENTAGVVGIEIDCGPPLYILSGTVFGFDSGDPMEVTVTVSGNPIIPPFEILAADGQFDFGAILEDGNTFSAAITQQPANGTPDVTCFIIANDNNPAVSNDLTMDITCLPPVEPVIGEIIPGGNPRVDWNIYYALDQPNPWEVDGSNLCPSGNDPLACVQSGVLREQSVPGLTDCTGVSAIDSAAAFQWTCVADASGVRVISFALNPGVGLADLLTPGPIGDIEWRAITIDITTPNGVITTSPDVWWNNVIETHDADGAQVLVVEGQIHVVTAPDLDITFAITGAGGTPFGSAIVTMPGASVTSTTSPVVNVSGVTSVWLEGTFSLADVGNFEIVNIDNSSVIVLNELTLSAPSCVSSCPPALLNVANSSSIRANQITATDNGGACIAIAGTTDGFFGNDIVVGNCGNGIDMLDTARNIQLTNVESTDNNGNGLDIASSNVVLDHVIVAKNSGDGVTVASGVDRPTNLVVRGLKATNNGSWGLNVSSADYPHIEDVVLAANGLGGLSLDFTAGALVRNAMVAANGIDNVLVNQATDTTIVNLLSVSASANGFAANMVTNLNVHHLTSTDNFGAAVAVSDSTDMAFFGDFYVTGMGSPCVVVGINNNVGVNDGLCDLNGKGDAALPPPSMTSPVIGYEMGRAFVGPTQDSVNTQGAGGVTGDTLSDLTNFENDYRFWVIDPALLPGACEFSTNCTIYDSRPVRNNPGLAGRYVGLGDTPVTHVWATGAVETDCSSYPVGAQFVSGECHSVFLPLAKELDGPTPPGGTQNYNGLCEDGEACLSFVNAGRYQGEGSLDPARTVGAGVTAIDLYAYACTPGDYVCGAGCTPQNDPDCDAVCGNNIAEQGEACDGIILNPDGMSCTATCEEVINVINGTRLTRPGRYILQVQSSIFSTGMGVELTGGGGGGGGGTANVSLLIPKGASGGGGGASVLLDATSSLAFAAGGGGGGGWGPFTGGGGGGGGYTSGGIVTVGVETWTATVGGGGLPGCYEVAGAGGEPSVQTDGFCPSVLVATDGGGHGNSSVCAVDGPGGTSDNGGGGGGAGPSTLGGGGGGSEGLHSLAGLSTLATASPASDAQFGNGGGGGGATATGGGIIDGASGQGGGQGTNGGGSALAAGGDPINTNGDVPGGGGAGNPACNSGRGAPGEILFYELGG